MFLLPLPSHPLAGLEELELSSAGLSRLPPQLLAANCPSLTRLVLDANPPLAVGTWDLERLLRRLRRLRCLQVQGSATAAARAALHLRLRAPQLQAGWCPAQAFDRRAHWEAVAHGSRLV